MSATVMSPPETHRAIWSLSHPPVTVAIGFAITITMEASVAH
jgi:hypothetical protein